MNSSPLTESEVKSTFSPAMQITWDAAVACLVTPTDATIATFRDACFPARILTLMREYAELKSHPKQTP